MKASMRWIFFMSPPVAFGTGLLLVLFFGLIDLLTGAEFSTEILYLLPIFLCTWFTGWWGGAFISLVSSLTWLATDIAFGIGHTHPAIPYWSVFVRLVSFLLMTYLFSELKLARERRRNLESIFFHDIYNVIGGIRGAAELLANADPAYQKELCRIIVEASDRAADEIDIQKTMAAMENRELEVSPSPISSRVLLEQVIECYQHHKAGQDRLIALSDTSQEAIFESDLSLLSRVLGNMIKNALEATAPGGTVTVGCAEVRGGIEFWVHNPGVVPSKTRKRIFQRTVSAKGQGRGMGTYSMRVLSEQLRGKISFTSFEGEGTTFRAWYPLKFQHP